MFQINQNNLHLLLPGKVSWLVEYLHDDYGLSLQDCLNRIYRSKLYKKLSTESTKYWHLGPVDLYNELKKRAIKHSPRIRSYLKADGLYWSRVRDTNIVQAVKKCYK